MYNFESLKRLVGKYGEIGAIEFLRASDFFCNNKDLLKTFENQILNFASSNSLSPTN